MVRVLQRPLEEIGGQVGALRALGVTDSITISFHLAFYAGIVLSLSVPALFPRAIRSPSPDRGGEKVLFPAIGVSFALFLIGVLCCYYWLLPKTILFSLTTPSR
mgnify:CR=1 FL=1